MALLYHRPRAATVHALTDCSLLKISAAGLEELFAGSPGARGLLLDAASRRLPSLYLASIPMFAGLDATALRELDLESNWAQGGTGSNLVALSNDRGN